MPPGHSVTGLHVDDVWFVSSWYVPSGHAEQLRSFVTHGSAETRSPGPHLLHGVHCAALLVSEKVLLSQLAHSRSVDAVLL